MVLSAESLFANFSTVFKTHLECQLRRIPTQANAISPFVGMPPAGCTPTGQHAQRNMAPRAHGAK